MPDRKFNKNDEQIRAESVHQANYNAAPGTPMRIVLAEAMLVEEYIRNGADQPVAMMREMRDRMDQADIASYIGLAQAQDKTPPSEEEHSGVVDNEPIVVRDPVVEDVSAFQKYQKEGLSNG